MHRPFAAILLLFLASCASPLAGPGIAQRVDALLPADAILLGEQHDAPEHQQIHRGVVATLAARGALAALALEMVDQGKSTTGLATDASETAVQAALAWGEQAWPWAAYGPAVMAAVRAGVPVLGANLPRARMHAAMGDSKLDMQLPGPALKAQQQAIRLGHCGLLPESQISPMTRIQVARDQAMARTVVQAGVPGKTVVLLAGAGHVDRMLGVPQHLPASLNARAVLLLAGKGQAADAFDATWTTPPVPEKDHCAQLRQELPARP